MGPSHTTSDSNTQLLTFFTQESLSIRLRIIFSNFDFNTAPFAPTGTKLLVHLKPVNRRSFGAHRIDGWYI